jgi:transmembrane protein 41
MVARLAASADGGPFGGGTLVALGLFFTASLGAFVIAWASPPLLAEQHERLVAALPPRSFDDAKAIVAVLEQYTDSHRFSVIGAYLYLYIFLQTFSIPGSLFLSFIGGALFGFELGVILADIAGTVGAMCAYGMAYIVGRRLLERFFPSKLETFAARVEAQRRNLFLFMLSCRFTPIVPNWFVNAAAPVCSVPLHVFASATSIGILPQTLLAVRAGVTLHDLNHMSEVLDVRYFLSLSLLGLIALVPTFPPVQGRLERWMGAPAAGKKSS